MALVRCKTCGRPEGKKLTYAHSHKLASDARTRIFCGTRNCTNLALVCWLTDEEEQHYFGGERFFTVPLRERLQVT